MLASGKKFKSPGGSFCYEVQGPVCRLYDREELPWPSCSLQWKGKQPSWRRIGARFTPDLSCKRFPSYAVKAIDSWGCEWYEVKTIYGQRLTKDEASWWYSRRNERNDYPESCPNT